ncbi:MAG: 50S ribosomal protein L32 [Clostridiales bacterium]|jgi:large subunit ribosomal protein L32|nr:50S ribosomal protein L32 [Clostridiales bacterium]
MAVPKRKTSKQRSATRYAQWKLKSPAVVECPQCHKPKLSHRVCGACGYYDKNRSVEVKQEEKK